MATGARVLCRRRPKEAVPHVTALAKGVPYRWDGSPADHVSEQTAAVDLITLYRFHISMTWLCKGKRLWI
jgi:hypothetical protein